MATLFNGNGAETWFVLDARKFISLVILRLEKRFRYRYKAKLVLHLGKIHCKARVGSVISKTGPFKGPRDLQPRVGEGRGWAPGNQPEHEPTVAQKTGAQKAQRKKKKKKTAANKKYTAGCMKVKNFLSPKRQEIELHLSNICNMIHCDFFQVCS